MNRKTKTAVFLPIVLALFSLFTALSLWFIQTPGTTVPTTPETTIPEIPQEAGYRIEKEGESCYFVFDDESKYAPVLEPGSVIAVERIGFSSISEMKTRVLNGLLTEQEKKYVSIFTKDKDGRRKCPDFYKLYSPNFPQNYEVSLVSWGYSVYHIYLRSNTPEYKDCSISVHYKEDYENLYKDECVDSLFNNDFITITNIEYLSERNATEYYYKTSASEAKVVFYTIEGDGGKLTVKEEYVLQTNNDKVQVSETVPSSIYFYGEFDGCYFRCRIKNPTQRPSVEWLSEFAGATVV